MKLYKFKENFELHMDGKPSVDVKEGYFQKDDDKLIVQIEAIHAVTTGNYNTYLADELKGSFEKRTGVFSWTHPYDKPVLTHHNSRDGEPIGRVIEAKYESTSEAGPPVNILTVEITDKDAIEKIKDGRYQTVSIGGHAEHAYCSICGHDWIEDGWCEHWPGNEYDGKVATLEMADLTFIEVSFVNVPADSYAKIIDVEEDEDVESEEFYKVDNGKAIKENMQGGKEDMDLKELQEKHNELQESYNTKVEKLGLLEEKLAGIEEERDALVGEKENIEEKNETLELKLEKLQGELDDLTEENAELKDKQHNLLAEKVVAKKIELEKIDKETAEEAIESHKKRTEDSLKDTLEDLKLEEQRLAEEDEDVVEPGEEVEKEGLHNAEEEGSVKTVEEDELENGFDINEELKNL